MRKASESDIHLEADITPWPTTQRLRRRLDALSLVRVRSQPGRMRADGVSAFHAAGSPMAASYGDNVDSPAPARYR